MELRQLKYFLAVADQLSFTKAAGQVHIVQSGLSTAIRNLERELGVELFHRTGHDVLLTDAGTALVIEARKVLASVESARDTVAAVEGGIRGELRVGILQSLALTGIIDVLTDLRELRPNIDVVLHVDAGGSQELVRAVQANQLDVAFVARPATRPAGIDVVPLTAELLALAIPKTHWLSGRDRIDLAELDGETFVDYPPGWGLRRQVDDYFDQHELTRDISIEVPDCRTALKLALADFGIAFVIPSAVQPDDALLHEISPALTFETALAINARVRRRPVTDVFVDLVKVHFGGVPSVSDRIASGDI